MTMSNIKYIALSLLALLSLGGCQKNMDTPNTIEGKDHFISSFELSKDGGTYQGAVVGDKIILNIPYNINLKGATVQYTLSEGATINPDPATIKDWDTEWKFVVTSKSKESKTYYYTYQFDDIVKPGSITLATQTEIDHFASTGVNKIEGNLIIGSEHGEEITNLKGLSHLKQISNTLIIHPSYKGEDLSGLDNLEWLGGLKLGTETIVSNNSSLKTINLPALTHVQGDFIVNSRTIERISIPKLERIEESFWVASDAFLDLDAGSLSSIGTTFAVRCSEAAKETALTEAIFLPSLQYVGNNFEIKHFSRLQGAFLPELKEVAGTISFENLPALGDIALLKLELAGGLKIGQCSGIKIMDFPILHSCGAININAENAMKFNIESLKAITGDISLSGLLIEEIDISKKDFNGYALTLKCNELKKIKGPKIFNGSLHLLPERCSLVEFNIEGISEIKGDFTCIKYYKVKKFVMPFEKIMGNVTVSLNTGSIDTGVEIDFPKLNEIGGTFLFKGNNNASKVSFGKLKTIGGSCEISSNLIESSLLFPNLESIGLQEEDINVTFNIIEGDISCPKLTTVAGDFNILTSDDMTGNLLIDRVSYPNLKSVYENLTIKPKYYNNDLIKSIYLPHLKTAKGVYIEDHEGLTDFSTFKLLFTENILTDEIQWAVSFCGYNPTFEDMKAGRYKPTE